MRHGRGLPTLALVTTLALVPAGYAARHGVVEGALQLVSAATGSPATDAEPTDAESTTAQPATAAPAPRASTGQTPAKASAAKHRLSAKAAVVPGSSPRGAVRAASVVPIPGPPAPPLYPWQVWSWATATPGSNEPCLPRFGPGHLPMLTLRTTNNAAVATWTHNGDATVMAYYLAWHADGGNRAQREAPIQWLKVTPPAGCTGVTAPLPSLPKGHYHLWMEMDVSTPELPGTKVSRVGLSQANFDIA